MVEVTTRRSDSSAQKGFLNEDFKMEKYIAGKYILLVGVFFLLAFPDIYIFFHKVTYETNKQLHVNKLILFKTEMTTCI